jgi:hypothetical protein
VRTVLLILLACSLPGTAHAGRSFYGWLYGTELLPERGVELQTWIVETNKKYANDLEETSIWWGPQIGVTDQLEISLPIEMYWSSAVGAEGASFNFRRFGIEARYRLAVPDPVEAPPFVPLVRFAAKRVIGARDGIRLEGDVVASYESGAVHALIDVGFIAEIEPGNRHTEMRPSGGVSIRVAGDFRLGAELYSEVSMDSKGVSWAAVGPNLAWTHGRFWLSAAFGFGIYHIGTAPRVMWGIAF